MLVAPVLVSPVGALFVSVTVPVPMSVAVPVLVIVTAGRQRPLPRRPQLLHFHGVCPDWSAPPPRRRPLQPRVTRRDGRRDCRVGRGGGARTGARATHGGPRRRTLGVDRLHYHRVVGGGSEICQCAGQPRPRIHATHLGSLLVVHAVERRRRQRRRRQRLRQRIGHHRLPVAATPLSCSGVFFCLQFASESIRSKRVLAPAASSARRCVFFGLQLACECVRS
mmetsp:Transcript_169/g.444  ORF Transcript_169/g.444 Transcript_169/m.444 type:complete len:223 (-) Transcript_169:103-771(-)